MGRRSGYGSRQAAPSDGAARSYLGPRPRVWIAALLVLWSATAAWTLTFLADPQKLVQVRNGLVATSAPESEFRWVPDNRPAEFRQEAGRIPPEIQAAVRAALGDERTAPGTWDSALALARHLSAGTRVIGGAIQSDTVSAYLAIRKSGGGYCADYTQVMNGLAYAAGIDIREWGMSFGNFSGDGHAFSEVYDPERGKWVFLDPFYSFYVLDASSGEPLSVLEFAAALRGGAGAEALAVQVVDPEAFSFPGARAALEYYRRGADRVFLGMANDVFTYDADPVVSWASRFGRKAEQAPGLLFGAAPGILILETDTNGDAIRALRLSTASFVLAVVLWGVATAGIVVAFARRARQRL